VLRAYFVYQLQRGGHGKLDMRKESQKHTFVNLNDCKFVADRLD
jgi:hypothetical protein